MNPTIIVLVIYLLTMLSVAWFFSRKTSLEEYFLNKKETGIWLLTLSTVSTVVGAGATVAIVAEVYNTGISYGLALPISFLIGMIIFALMARKIKEVSEKYNAYSIVDFFKSRFDRKNEVLAIVLQLLLLTGWIAVQATAFASLATVLIGINFQVALIFSAIVTILYTAVGGLKVDIITDFIQFWIIMFIFIVMSVIAFGQIDSLPQLLSQLPKGHLDPFAFGGISWFVGVIVLSGFIYLGNTSHWQRIFSAKSTKVARNSFLWTLPLILLLSLLVVFLGLVAQTQLGIVNKDTAIFSLMENLLSPWMVGVGFAAILAVIMSSIDSLLIGGSTILHKSVFKAGFGSERGVLYARIITGLFGVFGFAIAWLLGDIVITSLLVSYLALIFVPAILAGIYSEKHSPEASFYSLLIPAILLFALFPIMQEQTFIVSTLLAFLIMFGYDWFFRKLKGKQGV